MVDMGAHAGDLLYYGYRLRTELPLGGLTPLAEGPAADILLAVGEVPDRLEYIAWSSPFIEIGADGTALMRLGEHARFLVSGGREILLNPEATGHMKEVEFFLLGMVAGVVLHQRGDLALHASCVRIDGRAVAITGVSGCGKSTLAALLAAQGHQPLTDDVCRVQFRDGAAFAVPGSPRLRLWPDAAQRMGHADDALAVGRPGHPKRLLIPTDAPDQPLPLAAVIRLDLNLRLEAPTLERLRGPETIERADQIVYRVRMCRRMGLRVGVFRDLARLAGIVPVYRLTRTVDAAHLLELDRLVASAATGVE